MKPWLIHPFGNIGNECQIFSLSLFLLADFPQSVWVRACLSWEIVQCTNTSSRRSKLCKLSSYRHSNRLPSPHLLWNLFCIKMRSARCVHKICVKKSLSNDVRGIPCVEYDWRRPISSQTSIHTLNFRQEHNYCQSKYGMQHITLHPSMGAIYKQDVKYLMN